MPLSRRSFLSVVPAAGLIAAARGQPTPAPTPAAPAKDKDGLPIRTGIPDKGPRLGIELVRDFVYFAHSSLDEVRARLKDHPEIINAAWDWGHGDFETALGAASHMGRRDIAELLLENSARLDIFAATMLGDLDTVKAVLAAHPGALHTPGPHGIPLIRHAKAGGERAAQVLAFLESLK